MDEINKTLTKKITLTSLFILNILIILGFWYFNNQSMLTGDSLYNALGRITGLIGTYLFLIQILLISKIKFIENTYGHDKLSRIHHYNGIVAFGLLFLHGLFLTIGYKLISNISFLSQLLKFIGGDEIGAAIFAFVILIIIIILSITLSKIKMKYELWYLTHLFTYLVIILAFSHQIENGMDLYSNNAFLVYWYVLYIIIIGLLVVYRFLVPIYNYYVHRFVVSRVVKENQDIVSIYIRGNKLNRFKFKAGQFGIFRFLDKTFYEAHPFSFSRAHSEIELRISIKNLGDFTSKVHEIKRGTPIIIEGPLGTFHKDRIKHKNVVLIAGGIGITPIRSLIEELTLDPSREITLIYSVKDDKDIVFREELNSLKEKNHNHYYHSSNKFGHLNEDKLRNVILNPTTTDFFVCGPPGMTNHIIKLLKRMGVSKKRIHHEKFSF
ncbi:MAG: ferric reductase-like transmembrane domain-containing protein [archaeon]